MRKELAKRHQQLPKTLKVGDTPQPSLSRGSSGPSPGPGRASPRGPPAAGARGSNSGLPGLMVCAFSQAAEATMFSVGWHAVDDDVCGQVVERQCPRGAHRARVQGGGTAGAAQAPRRGQGASRAAQATARPGVPMGQRHAGAPSRLRSAPGLSTPHTRPPQLPRSGMGPDSALWGRLCESTGRGWQIPS